MKHDNVVMFMAFLQNWRKIVIYDDTIFITSCICEAIDDNIRWLINEE
jgi:hypothetical protein